MGLVTNEGDFIDHPLTVSDIVRQIQERSSCIVLYASLKKINSKNFVLLNIQSALRYLQAAAALG